MTISQVAITEFKKEVAEALKAESKLLGFLKSKGCLMDMAFEGETIKMPFATNLNTVARGAYGSDVNVQRQNFNHKTANLVDYTLVGGIDDFEKVLVNFNSSDQLKKTIVNAIDLRKDQILIDKFNSLTYAAEPAQGQGHEVSTIAQPSVFDVDFLLDLMTKFDEANVPEEGRCILINARAKRQLMADPKYTSSDYASHKVLVDGKLVGFAGFDLQTIQNEDRDGEFYGLPEDNVNVQSTLFAFHTSALYPVFSALEHSSQMEIERDVKSRQWIYALDTRGGCLVTDENKVFKIVLDNSVVTAA